MINVMSINVAVVIGGTTDLVAMATGINTDENNFKYQWKKRGSNSLPDKASGVDGTVLTIPNALKADEGLYYCIVTNEWDRSVESHDVNLTVYGMLTCKTLYESIIGIENEFYQLVKIRNLFC